MELLTVNDAAKEIGVAPQTVINYERVGKLPAAFRTRGGVRLFKAEDVKRFKVERETKLAVEAAL